MFRPTLEPVFEKERKSKARARGFDKVMLFKCLIIQSLYNLSDETLEFQILDRLFFTIFLGIEIGGKVSDANTICRFREELVRAGVVKRLFKKFDFFLRDNGFQARCGQIIDAGIEKPKGHRCPLDQENGKVFFGYKNHISINAKHKLIRHCTMTDAAVHNSQLFEELLDQDNGSRNVLADSAYRTEERLACVEENGL